MLLLHRSASTAVRNDQCRSDPCQTRRPSHTPARACVRRAAPQLAGLCRGVGARTLRMTLRPSDDDQTVHDSGSGPYGGAGVHDACYITRTNARGRGKKNLARAGGLRGPMISRTVCVYVHHRDPFVRGARERSYAVIFCPCVRTLCTKRARSCLSLQNLLRRRPAFITAAKYLCRRRRLSVLFRISQRACLTGSRRAGLLRSAALRAGPLSPMWSEREKTFCAHAFIRYVRGLRYSS